MIDKDKAKLGDRVFELECGHESRSYGGVRAICTRCKKP